MLAGIEKLSGSCEWFECIDGKFIRKINLRGRIQKSLSLLQVTTRTDFGTRHQISQRTSKIVQREE
jgi:hypothetical protein